MKVLLFARMKDLVGRSEIEIALPSDCRVADLRRIVVELHPSLETLMPKCAVAINDDYAGDDVAIRDGDRIALLPPVSGG